jgi:hypothetical protein
VAAIRARLFAHVIVVMLLWPLATILGTAIAVHDLPYYSPSWSVSFGAAAAGVVVSAVEFGVAAAAVLAMSLGFFALAASRHWVRNNHQRPWDFWPEALLTFLALLWGASLWYPVALRQPLLIGFTLLPMLAALGVIAMAVVALSASVATPGSVAKVAAALLVVGAALPVPSVIARSRAGGSQLSSLVLLGLDSAGVGDTTPEFNQWVGARHGTVYERAVTPALLTNAVWASVLSAREPAVNGVLHAFQEMPRDSGRVLTWAKQAGFWTVSSFSNQLSCSVGTDAAFDEDRSGPLGWRHLILQLVHNSSLVLPLVRPVLPRSRIFASTPNLAGSFSYSVGRDIREILFAGRDGMPTFVAGHQTYLHLSSFPTFLEMNWNERWRVLRSPVREIQDRSLDWSDSDHPDDAIPVHEWKRRALFSAVQNEVDRSGFLEQGGRLVLFSDHGERSGLNETTFVEPKYHHVILTTFNLPARDPARPRSLIDIGLLLGLTGEAFGKAPSVELAIFPSEMWASIAARAKLDWSGRVHLDEAQLALVASRMKTFEPWPER